MALIISDEILKKANLDEGTMLIDIAVYLYEKRKLSFGKAKNFANLNHLEFQNALAERNVYMNYDEDDFEDDLKTLGIKSLNKSAR
jgi:predicted HTH domain antitoxin